MAETTENEGAPDGERETRAPVWTAAVVLVLPVLYLVSALVLRTDAGPFWLWHAGLPGYAFLLDAVNLLNHYAPGYVIDPGTPVQAVAALVLMSAHGFADVQTVTEAVLADPESHLRAITTVLYALNAFALVAVGLAARAAAGRLIPALIVQSGPFMSTAVMHHGLYLSPEALLIPTMLALAFVTLLAMRPGWLERRRVLFAIAFGGVAGFGLAVKAAAAPVFVLPIFLLWGLRPLAAYLAVTAVVFGIFTVPAAGAFEAILAGLAAGTADPAHYGQQILRMLSRPVLSVPVVMALLALLAAFRRSRTGGRVPGPAMRALAGTALAQILLAALVRQTDAEQLIPDFVLSALTLSLVYSVVAGLEVGSPRLCFWSREITAILFGVFLLVQGAALVGQDIELRDWRKDAARVDNAAFDQCTRVYFNTASDPSFALFAADRMTGNNWPDLLAAEAPPNDLWFDTETLTIRDWYGEADLLEYLAIYPCALFRGTDRQAMEAYLDQTLPGLILRDGCSTGHEAVLTMGVDCTGNLIGN